jgi:hypothetical protein
MDTIREEPGPRGLAVNDGVHRDVHNVDLIHRLAMAGTPESQTRSDFVIVPAAM